MDTLRLTGRIDGGNPQEEGAIRQTADRNFVIKPYSEDGDAGYKFRLDVDVENPGEGEADLSLIIDWEESQYNQYRDVVYLGTGGDVWQPLQGKIEDSTVLLDLKVPAGRSHLTLNPSYGYSRYMELINRLDEGAPFSKSRLYTTTRGREVYLLRARAEGRTSKRILVTGRTHPYESAGSYAVEGIVEGMLNGLDREQLKDCDLWILPMMCPDGVADGLCRLNEPGAPDLSREIDSGNPLCRAYMDLIDEIKPTFFLEFHNWMLRNNDGIFYLSWWPMVATIGRLRRGIPETRRKPMIRGLDRWIMKRRAAGLKGYAARRHSGRCMTVEYPWHGRSVRDLKELGMQTLLAVVPIA
ncbi:MAG: hypothetical protein LAO21_21495 [Acidobacteriia bacterium]|nr:hypothetical protein [Terriglobia bacterium]